MAAFFRKECLTCVVLQFSPFNGVWLQYQTRPMNRYGTVSGIKRSHVFFKLDNPFRPGPDVQITNPQHKRMGFSIRNTPVLENIHTEIRACCCELVPWISPFVMHRVNSATVLLGICGNSLPHLNLKRKASIQS